MLNVTENAARHLQEIGEVEPGVTAVRVAIMGSSTSSGLGLMVDRIKDEDISSIHNGHTVIIDRQLLEYCRQVTIDFREGESDGCSSKSGRGFLLNAEEPISF